MNRGELLTKSRKRVSNLRFGYPVTNVAASEDNPTRSAYFVRKRGLLVQCTNKKGKFWQVGIEVVFPGHLSVEESSREFRPIHAVLFPTGGDENE